MPRDPDAERGGEPAPERGKAAGTPPTSCDDLAPDPSRSREAMERQQRAVAEAATFADDGAPRPSSVAILGALAGRLAGDEPVDVTPRSATAPVVVGVDQAFRDGGDRAVSAAVAVRDGRVIERADATRSVETPYIPGLLAYREAPVILDALRSLDVDPDLLLLDGSGRIHYRQAGIATHVGVLLDVPAVGVAKSLLCGEPRRLIEGELPLGARVGIEADDEVDAPDGTTIGYAYQSRTFGGNRHVNPLYVSPGHRVGAGTAVDLVAVLCAGYKLPEPTRLADRAADAPD